MRLSRAKQTLYKALRHVGYFDDLSENMLLNLVNTGYPLTLPAHEYVCWEKDPGNCFYIILSGQVEAFSQHRSKKVEVLKPGDFFGEIAVLLGTPRTLSVRTLTETRLFILDHAHLQQLFLQSPFLADSITHKLCIRWKELISLGIFANSDDYLTEAACLQFIYRRIRVVFNLKEVSDLS